MGDASASVTRAATAKITVMPPGIVQSRQTGAAVLSLTEASEGRFRTLVCTRGECPL